ncbi:MAG: hypothetical protein JWS12_515 [Candidatus Saccharibacteria bacterium]|nr:hypothetical protein [Candidatus Saccharibacteria bacterium]
MSENPASALRKTTSESRASSVTRAAEAEEWDRREKANERKRQSRAANRFADEQLEVTIESLTGEMQAIAEYEGDSVTKEWTAYSKRYGMVDQQERANHRTLRRKVAEHFTGLNFAVELFEHTAREQDPRIPLSDGYSPEHPPMRDIGLVTGIAISWADQE